MKGGFGSVASDRPTVPSRVITLSQDSPETPVWHVDAARGPSTPSLDHLVGAGDERRRDVKAKRLRGLEVNDQLELRRLLHRKLAGLRALENLVDEGCELAI